MILKAKKAADHMEFGAFISREIRLLKLIAQCSAKSVT